MTGCARPTLALLALLAAAGCAPKPVPQQAAPPQDTIALLPDPETTAVGHAVVSSPSGASVELTTERQATRVAVGQPPSPPVTLSQADVQRLFGDALAARPPAPRQFLLYFLTGSDELTPEGLQLLSEILTFVKNRPSPDVTVIGHTDTIGTAPSNTELGLRRATMIRNRLVAAGLDSALVSVASHGESDPLVPTPDNTAEAKNRRVEVSVR
jgi:outer membrane protein OmpA-like peptidoglycan-associated protein